MKTRESGILLPIFSLASRFGIGCLSKEAYDFVDFLEKSGQGFWQILPVGPTGYGNSPYQPVSSFAGNPYFISLEDLIEKGLLTWDEVNGIPFGDNPEKVDYGAMYMERTKILKKAYARFVGGDPETMFAAKVNESESDASAEAAADAGNASDGAFAETASADHASAETAAEGAAASGVKAEETKGRLSGLVSGIRSAISSFVHGGAAPVEESAIPEQYREIYREFQTYCAQEKFWLQDYALYVAIKEKEGQAILKNIRPDDRVVCLSVKAQAPDSPGLAKKMAGWMKDGRRVALVIGGSNGLSDEVIRRADEEISFSNLTFPHGLMRVILLEQLYRAEKILAGEKYHK